MYKLLMFMEKGFEPDGRVIVIGNISIFLYIFFGASEVIGTWHKVLE